MFFLALKILGVYFYIGLMLIGLCLVIGLIKLFGTVIWDSLHAAPHQPPEPDHVDVDALLREIIYDEEIIASRAAR